jgi:hypothetical protein
MTAVANKFHRCGFPHTVTDFEDNPSASLPPINGNMVASVRIAARQHLVGYCHVALED